MPPSSLMQKLASEILVSDGAMGTELQKYGLPVGSCPELYNSTHPDVVESIHRSYLAAGADLITTNSFGGNRFRLRMYGLEGRAADLSKTAAEIARRVCPSDRYVGGSIGPTGEILEPLGTGGVTVIREAFREQVEALAEGGVDLFIVETMMAIEEAELAISAAKEATGLPVAATMTFEPSPHGYRTMWGVDVPTAVQHLSDAGADIIGANCGRGFDEMVGIIRGMRPLTQKPLLSQPNAGLPQWTDGKAIYPESADLIGPKVEMLLAMKVNILGGCCGTSPEHIRRIRQIVDAYKPTHSRTTP
jgi:5-methyltetrahydrofolate--homocysteine methyltransferase